MVELMILVGFLLVLDAGALLFGVDSRDGMDWKEQCFSRRERLR